MKHRMTVLWICGLPYEVQREALGGTDHGAQHECPWILGLLPPPSNIELHIACLWPNGKSRKDFEYKGAFFHLLPCPGKGRATTFFFFDHLFYRRLFREIRPEVVHGWGTEDSNALVAEHLMPSAIVSVQGVISEICRFSPKSGRMKRLAFLERRAFKRAACLISESAYSASLVKKYIGKKEVQIIDQPLRRQVLESSPCGEQEKKAVYVGSLRKAKGYEDALYAFAKAASRGWCMEVIGDGTERDEKTFLNLVGRLGLKGRVIWRHRLPVKQVIESIKSASIFLLPTYVDSGPTALKEALSLGVWPVCYDNSGPGEYIRRFKFGSLAETGNKGELARVLRHAIQKKVYAAERKNVMDRIRSELAAAAIWPQLINQYINSLKISSY